MQSLFLASFLFAVASVLAQSDLESEPASSPAPPAPGNGTSEDSEVPTYFSPFAASNGVYALGAFAKVNWFQAQATCAAYGYTLVTIASESEQRALRNFLFTYARVQLDIFNDPLWTSGTDLASENSWVWLSNGRAFDYRNFQNGLPGTSSAGRNCLAINGITGLWVNEYCSEKLYFVCQKRCLFDGDAY